MNFKVNCTHLINHYFNRNTNYAIITQYLRNIFKKFKKKT